MSDTGRPVHLSFFQEHSRQSMSAGHRKTWTVAVVRDNEPLGRLAPWLFASSEGLWRAAAHNWPRVATNSRSGAGGRGAIVRRLALDPAQLRPEIYPWAALR